MKSNKQVLLAACAIVVAMVFGWYQVIWSGQTAAIAKANTAAATAAASAAQLSQKSKQLEVAKEDTRRTRLLQKLDVAVPADPSLPSYLRWITDLAGQHHLGVPTVSHAKPVLAPGASAAPAASAPPSAGATPAAGGAAANQAGAVTPATTSAAAATGAASADSASLYQIILSIQANGTYSDLLEFIHQLELSPRLIIVDSVTITPGGGGLAVADPAGDSPTSSVQVEPAMSLTVTARMFSTNSVDSTTATSVTTVTGNTGATP